MSEQYQERDYSFEEKQQMIYALSDEVYLPGVTRKEKIETAVLDNGVARMEVSPVGATTLGFWVDGKKVFSTGPTPFAQLVELPDGTFSYAPPYFLRGTDHTPLVNANQDESYPPELIVQFLQSQGMLPEEFIAPDDKVRDAIYAECGIDINDFYTWHHNGFQVSIYDQWVTEDRKNNPMVISSRDFKRSYDFPHNSPWDFKHISAKSLEGRKLVEQDIIINTAGANLSQEEINQITDQVMILSHARHTYYHIPGGREHFQKSTVWTDKGESFEVLYSLREYEAKAQKYEKNINPMPDNVVLVTEDRVVKSTFGGYDPENDSVQFFSPWTSPEEYEKEATEKRMIDAARLEQGLDLARKYGVLEYVDLSVADFSELLLNNDFDSEGGLAMTMQPQTPRGDVLRRLYAYVRARKLRMGEKAELERVTEVEWRKNKKKKKSN